ncbi:hypothetical protein B0H63DRAFT_463784 [Podospora didyma]|uniref:Uncharacterized protein n=1 Tax=Podospora didyma TaxID=330526 RepID=A0AAE0U3I0_9PEZI|nr:hypothetical protein B0H63DRAFT_463784 [Podospora didyma]
MKLAYLFVVIFHVALATSLFSPKPVHQDLHIVLHRNTVTSESALQVWSSEQSEVLYQSCSASLDSGPFEGQPIRYDVDNSGAGNITIGHRSFRVHEAQELSGGVRCERMRNQAELVVNCTASVSGASQLPPLKMYAVDDCFIKGHARWGRTTRRLRTGAILVRSQSHAKTNIHDSREYVHFTSKRQGACGTWSSNTYAVGDGDPHQNPIHIQVTDPIECDGDGSRGCDIEPDRAQSFQILYYASANLNRWIDGGFAVQQSIDTREPGTAVQCGNNDGGMVALWKKVGYTRYTVQNAMINECTGTQLSTPFQLWSPNSHDDGDWYCVYGDKVGKKGDQWREDDGPAGAPPS